MYKFLFNLTKITIIHILLWGVIMTSLNKLSINKKAKVITISDKSLIKRRLLDIGIIPGIEIEKILTSPFKGISAYLVMDSIIAIRDIDATHIEVCYD